MVNNYKKLIYQTVQQIPKGKVSTYGKISEYVNKHLTAKSFKLAAKITARLVGQILHQNPDPKNIPCYRIVNSQGELAKNYAFGGWKKQKEILLKEKVVFKDKLKVDLGKCLLNP